MIRLRTRGWRACLGVVLLAAAQTSASAAPRDDLDDPPLVGTPPQTWPSAPARPEPAQPAPAKPEPAKPAPKPEPAKPSSPKPEPPKAEPPKPESNEPATGPVPWPTVPGASLPTPAEAPVAPVAPVASVAPGAPSPRASTHETRASFTGQGSLLVDRDRQATGEVPWLIAGVAHRPVPWFRLVASAELEALRVFAMEQLFVEVSPHPAFGVRAGLLVLPLGMINRSHVTTSFPTVERPLTDRLIVPSTWRELGAGIFGALGDDARYEVLAVSGLDAAGFAASAPLWGGRGNGRSIAVRDAAVVGRLELGRAGAGFAMGGGGYFGGATGGRDELSGVRVAVAEADARYRGWGFDLRAEFAELFIVNSYRVNDYLGLLGQDAVPAAGRGFYAQAGVDVLCVGESADDLPGRQRLVLFAAFENVNPRSRMSQYNFNPATITGPGELPPNAPSPSRSFVRGGINYQPWPFLAVKVDVQVALDAEGAPPLPPMTLMGAPGVPKPLPGYLTDAARGRTRVGFALAWAF
jgi:hypothetical protein